jgi:hypothetical protein
MKGFGNQKGLIVRDKKKVLIFRWLLFILLSGCPVLAFSMPEGIKAKKTVRPEKTDEINLPGTISAIPRINTDSLTPDYSASLQAQKPVSFLSIQITAAYQAIGIDTVISLYPKKNTGAGIHFPVQELYRGKKLKIDFYHDKVAGKITLQSDEPMLEIIIYNDRAEEVYTAVSVNNHHKIPLATYKKGRYSIFITGARSRSVQFFFQQSE